MTWTEIARRAQDATGPDRKLAATIARLAGWRPGDGEPGSNTSAPWAWCPDFTGSVDAVLDLIAEKLPGKPWTVFPEGFGFDARVDFYEPDNYCATPALALLAAFARAMAADTPPSKGDQ